MIHRINLFKRSVLSRIVLCTLILLSPLWGAARPQTLGVGGVIGRPQGLTIQVPEGRGIALNGSLFYDFTRPRFDIHLDQIFIQSKTVLEAFHPYVGIGGRLSIHSNRGVQDAGGLTARVPIGLELGESHLRAFIELTPALEVLPALGFTLQGAIGIRYHF